MTALDLEYFETRLLEMQAQVMGIAGLVAGAAGTVELDQNRVGRLSRMDAMQGQAMAQASAARQAHQLKLIEFALQRIDDGVYGLCLECDNKIAVARLEIDPATEYCISCAEKLER
ncbi:MAG: TraR/DksA C4-type zinc finger protein [Arenicella sp.]|nr:TraR/DksA C4-type zinc finger protein [Arenicella sp.]